MKNKSVKARKKGPRDREIETERKSFGSSCFLSSSPVCPKLFPGAWVHKGSWGRLAIWNVSTIYTHWNFLNTIIFSLPLAKWGGWQFFGLSACLGLNKHGPLYSLLLFAVLYKSYSCWQTACWSADVNYMLQQHFHLDRMFNVHFTYIGK